MKKKFSFSSENHLSQALKFTIKVLWTKKWGIDTIDIIDYTDMKYLFDTFKVFFFCHYGA